MRRKRLMSARYRPEAAIEASRLFPRHLYQVSYASYVLSMCYVCVAVCVMFVLCMY